MRQNPRDVINFAFSLSYNIYMDKEYKKFYHVSLGYHNNILVAYGVNKNKKHPKLIELGYRDISLVHAELDLLLKYQGNFKDLDIINFCFAATNVRRGKIKPHTSKPCVHCASFVSSARSITFLTEQKRWVTV